MTDIICTTCGEMFSLEGDSVPLPFVCDDCEKKQEEFELEATAQESDQQEQGQTEDPVVQDLLDRLEAYQFALGIVADEYKIAGDEADALYDANVKLAGQLKMALIQQNLDSISARNDAVYITRLLEQLRFSRDREAQTNASAREFVGRSRMVLAERDEALENDAKYIQSLNTQHATLMADNARLMDANERQASTIRQLGRPWYEKLSDWYYSLGQYLPA